MPTQMPASLTRSPGGSAVLLRVALLRRSLASLLLPSRQVKARVGLKRVSRLGVAPGSARRLPLALPTAVLLPGGPRPGARRGLELPVALTVRLLILTPLSGLDRRQAPACGGASQGPWPPAGRPQPVPASGSPGKLCLSFFFLAFWLASILTTEEGEGPGTAEPAPKCSAGPGSLGGASVPRRPSLSLSEPLPGGRQGSR